ncbi:MAG TPA: DUF177 domain-containing protein [Prolixibacteraceae bacterium]|nr:DUF177 domain-containing protein [Prolixibacteraceae bacterium]
MNYLSQYTLPFSGLSEGKHQFDFTADDRFFAEFETSEVEKGELMIQVELEKRSTYLSLTFFIKGTVELVCDRCLENFIYPLESNRKLLVKFSEKQIEDEAELIYLHPNDFQVEIAQYIYEFVILSLPIRRVHPDGENGETLCDPVMIKKLEELRHHSDNLDEPDDPRWNELRKFIGN